MVSQLDTKVMQALAMEQNIPDDRAIRLWNSLDIKWLPEDDFGMNLAQPQWVLDAHNKQSGRCFIMGTGPSLAGQSHLLPRLGDEITFTVNRMRHFKDGMGFTPTHHCLTEAGPIGEMGKMVWEPYDFPEAKNRIAIHWFPVTAPGWLWVAKAHDDVQVRWEGAFGLGDYLPPLPTAWASPFTTAQLALWFGFTEIYMLGVDTTQEGQAWDVARGRTTYPRSILSILECVDRLKCQIEKAGRHIYDCTPGGRINSEGVLEYRSLEDVLGTPS